VLLAGRPNDDSYLEDLKSLERAMEASRSELHFKAECLNHRRGAYSALSVGISYGGGSKVSASSSGHTWFGNNCFGSRSPESSRWEA
jgi:hypothetical protein